MAQAAHELGPTGLSELGPDTRAVGLEMVRADHYYFDVNNLPEIDEIDLSLVMSRHKSALSSTTPNDLEPKEIVRYLDSAAEGSIDPNEFDDLFSRVTGKILGNELLPEHIMAIAETIEKQRPRVTELMDRVNKEKIMSEIEFVTINKIMLCVSGLRLTKNI